MWGISLNKTIIWSWWAGPASKTPNPMPRPFSNWGQSSNHLTGPLLVGLIPETIFRQQQEISGVCQWLMLLIFRSKYIRYNQLLDSPSKEIILTSFQVVCIMDNPIYLSCRVISNSFMIRGPGMYQVFKNETVPICARHRVYRHSIKGSEWRIILCPLIHFS